MRRGASVSALCPHPDGSPFIQVCPFYSPPSESSDPELSANDLPPIALSTSAALLSLLALIMLKGTLDVCVAPDTQEFMEPCYRRAGPCSWCVSDDDADKWGLGVRERCYKYVLKEGMPGWPPAGGHAEAPGICLSTAIAARQQWSTA